MNRIKEVCIVTEINEKLNLGYFLLQSNEFYGVLIEAVKDGTLLYFEKVECVWETEEEALNSISFLAENEVTPTTLVEILDDIVA